MMNKKLTTSTLRAGMAGFAIAAAGLGLGASVSDVEAQSKGKSPVILIVDRERLVSQSKAGQTIPGQAEKVQENVRKELEKELEKLKTDVEKFQKNASLMSEEVRNKTGQELAGREQRLQGQAQIMERVFINAVQSAQQKVLLESRPILKDIVDDRGATILLDRSAVMYAAPETDVTQEVIANLDKKIKKVDVEDISLEDVMKKLEEAQKQQAEAQNGKKRKR
ncbi:MAG: OmpH family outer membrane protein [Parvularculaceae bacterium]